MTTSIKEHAQTTYSVIHYATCCCRPAHKRECKQKAQQQLRVNISSKPPGGGAGPANSWVGVNQSDVAKWFAGQVNGTGKGKYPEAKTMSGSIAVKHEKLFDVKIQVIVLSKSACIRCYLHSQKGCTVECRTMLCVHCEALTAKGLHASSTVILLYLQSFTVTNWLFA